MPPHVHTGEMQPSSTPVHQPVRPHAACTSAQFVMPSLKVSSSSFSAPKTGPTGTRCLRVAVTGGGEARGRSGGQGQSRGGQPRPGLLMRFHWVPHRSGCCLRACAPPGRRHVRRHRSRHTSAGPAARALPSTCLHGPLAACQSGSQGRKQRDCPSLVMTLRATRMLLK